MSLENFTEDMCVEKIKAVAGFYTNNKEERDSLFKKCFNYMKKEYSLQKNEKQKNEKIARRTSLMKTMEYMTEEVNKLYDSKRN